MTPHSGARGLCAALGAAVVLVVLGLHPRTVTPAQGDSVRSASTLMALGSGVKDKSGNGCLWLYHPDTRQLACYACEGGQAVRLMGARRVGIDLELEVYNDRSAHSPRQLRDMRK